MDSKKYLPVLNSNLEKAEEIIRHHKESDEQPLRVFDEIGANLEIAHTLQMVSGSSAVMYLAQSSYHKDTQRWNTKGWRSISKEFIATMLHAHGQTYPDKNIFVSSFQVEQAVEKITHGYIGIKYKQQPGLIVHITLPEPHERTTYQALIADVGLQLILHLELGNKIKTSYIDQRDTFQKSDKIEQDLATVINMMGKNSLVSIDKNGKVCRIEELTRTRSGYQPLVVYKGSFNPPHLGHVEIMEKMKAKYPGHIALFGMSVDTYDKGKIDTSELMRRVELLNKLGYPVLLFVSGYYKDNLDLLRHKHKQQIIFPMGLDTKQRVLDYVAKSNDNIEEQFSNVVVEVFSRGDAQLGNGTDSLFVFNQGSYVNLSSTQIRSNIQQYKHLVPESIQETCLKMYSK